MYDRVAILRHQFIAGCAQREQWIIGTLKELETYDDDPRAEELASMIRTVRGWFTV